MFKEHRLIFDSSTIESPNSIQTTPDVQQTPQLQSGIERALANADVKVKLEELKQQIHSANDTQNKMRIVTEISIKDSSEEVLTMLEAEISAEENNINTERSGIPVLDTENLTPEQITELRAEVDQKTNELRQKLQLVQQARETVLKARVRELQIEAKKPLIQKVGDRLENLGSMLPSEWSRNAKIATVLGTGAAAVYVGYKLLNWLRGKKGKNETESQQDKPSIFANKWALAGILGIAGIGAFFGIKHFRELQKIAKQAQEQAASLVNTGREKVEELLTGDKKWEEYDLTENNYNDARKYYLDQNEQSNAKIKEIFGLTANESSREYALFMADMEQEFGAIELDGISYRNYEVVEHNTEKTLRVVLQHLEEFVRDHPVEEAIAGIIAYKIGALQLALATTGTVFNKAVSVGKTLLRFGVKNPITSLLLVGGAAGTTFAAREQLRGAKGPQDFSEFISAANNNKPLFIDGQTHKPLENVTTIALDSVKNHFANIVGYAGNITDFIAQHTEQLFNDVATTTYEALSVTEQEVIFDRNKGAFTDVAHLLDTLYITEDAKTDKDTTLLTNIDAASNALLEYETAFFTERNETTFSPSTESIEALEKLRTTLAAINIGLTIQDGVVMIQTDEGIAKHVSIDPAITDVNEAFEASNQLNLGEGIATRAFFSALQYIRLKNEEFKNGGLETLGQNEAVGMIVGNVLYVANPLNLGEYVTYQFNSAKELMQLLVGQGDTNELGEALGGALATSMLFSLSAEVITQIKRLAIGGGTKHEVSQNFYRRWGGRLLNYSPGVHPAHQAFRAYRGLEDVIEFRSTYNQARQNGESILSAYKRARDVNTSFARAGIRPQWIRMIENGNLEQQIRYLKKIPGDNTQLIADLKNGDPQAKTKIREAIESKLAIVNNAPADLYDFAANNTDFSDTNFEDEIRQEVEASNMLNQDMQTSTAESDGESDSTATTDNSDNTNSDGSGASVETTPTPPENSGSAQIDAQKIEAVQNLITSASQEFNENGNLSDNTITMLSEAHQDQNIATIAAFNNTLHDRYETVQQEHRSNATSTNNAELQITGTVLRSSINAEVELRQEIITNLDAQISSADEAEKTNLEAEKKRHTNRIEAIMSIDTSAAPEFLSDLQQTTESNAQPSGNSNPEVEQAVAVESFLIEQIESTENNQVLTTNQITEITNALRVHYEDTNPEALANIQSTLNAKIVDLEEKIAALPENSDSFIALDNQLHITSQLLNDVNTLLSSTESSTNSNSSTDLRNQSALDAYSTTDAQGIGAGEASTSETDANANRNSNSNTSTTVQGGRRG